MNIIYVCKENQNEIILAIEEGAKNEEAYLDEILVRADGERNWVIIGSKDLKKAIEIANNELIEINKSK